MSANPHPTKISGSYELDGHFFNDHRGSFINCFRSQDKCFLDVWGDRPIAQINISRTKAVGSVRGLHLQAPPFCDAKLVRCLRGRVYDVVVDLRFGSPTWGLWHAVELSAQTANALLVPEGCAHGFQVLEQNTELLYLHSFDWVPKAETGVYCSDPELSIPWPLIPGGLSKKDQELPSLSSLRL